MEREIGHRYRLIVFTGAKNQYLEREIGHWYRLIVFTCAKNQHADWPRAVKRPGANSLSLVPDCAITWYQKFSLATLIHWSELKVPVAVATGTDACISTG